MIEELIAGLLFFAALIVLERIAARDLSNRDARLDDRFEAIKVRQERVQDLYVDLQASVSSVDADLRVQEVRLRDLEGE